MFSEDLQRVLIVYFILHIIGWLAGSLDGFYALDAHIG